MAVTDYKGITIEFRGETTDLQRKLAQIREEAKTTFSGLREVNKNLKFDDSSVVNLTQKQKYLQEAIKSTADRASAYESALRSLDAEAEKNGGLTAKQQAQHDQLERSLEQCKRQIDSYTDSLQRTTAEIDVHNSKLGQFGEQAETVGNKLQSAGRFMVGVGEAMTKYVTVPLAAGAGVAIKAATDLDTSYHNLTKTVDGTDQELERFKTGAIELSKVQPVSANTILDVEALGAQLGYSNSNLESFAKTVTGLDIATDMDAETAAMELAHFSNIMGMAQEDTERYGSTIVSLGNHFATTESDISSMALRIAGAGRQIGMSEADVLGLATALTSMGINAEAGGTAISTVMSEIDKSVANGTDGLQKWAEIGGVSVDELIAHMSAGDDWAKEFAKSQNSTLKEMQGVTSGALWQLQTWADTAKMSAEDFATAWRTDPVKALQAVFTGMEAATAEGSNMNLMLEDLGIESIRQTDMMKRLASNSNLVGEAVRDANTAWQENTALSKEVDNRNESLASKFEVLKNRATAVAAEVGKPLADALLAALDAADPLIKAIENGAEAFSKMDKQQQASIIQMVAFVAAAGPLITVLGHVTDGIGHLIDNIGSVAEGIPAFTSGMQQGMGVVESLNLVSADLGTTLSTGLFGIGIAAAAIAVVAFIGYLKNWYDEQEKTRQSHEDFANSIDNLSGAVHGALPDMESGADAIAKMGDQANFTRDDLDALTEAQSRLAENIKQRNLATQQNVDELEKARGIIEAYAGQVGLTADEQAKLRDAIGTVNEQCGTSYEVFDAANGKIREQGSDAEATADQIGMLIDKQIEQVKTNALLENMQDVYKNYYDQLDKLNTIETDLKETEEQRDAALKLLNEEVASGSGANAAHAQQVAELNAHLNELKSSYDDVRGSVDSSVEHMDFYDQELARISESTDGTKSALQSLVESTAALHAKLGDDTATQAFVQQLSDLGISASDYVNLSYTQLQALADNYDGTTESIRVTLEQFGVNATAEAKSAGTGIHDEMVNPTKRLPDDMGDVANQTRDSFNNSISRMPDDAKSSANETGHALNSTLGSYAGQVGSTANDLHGSVLGPLDQLPGDVQGIADSTGREIEDTIGSYADPVGSEADRIRESVLDPLSQLPDESGRYGNDSGYALTDELASGAYSNLGAVQDAADSIREAQRDADASGDAHGWGLDLDDELANGIWGGMHWISDAANAAAQLIHDVLGHTVPKVGVLHEGGKGEFVWGQHMVQNIARGVESEKPALARAVEELAKLASNSFDANLNTAAFFTGDIGASVNRVVASIEADVRSAQTQPMVINFTIENPTISDESDIDLLMQRFEMRMNQIWRARGNE